ncbi:cytidylyltransferase domain-containing protein [Pontibacter beigongshangensis]|uniref:cytidylyltransferase domain-containing protein n=1 Tax=Pontibacter beigongshangensis TaxID=2574733 RepID=UPI00165003F7|nr:glycosyltransferase family protein [Pontibacter beigongshangensis]
MCSKKIGVVTQARMTSTRLPGKVLLQAGGKTLLQHHTDRLREAGLDVYIATTTNTTDDVIAEFAQQEGLKYCRGDEQHVLSRFYTCATKNELDVIVRVTSDCPLIDGHLIKDAIQKYLTLEDDLVYLSNVLDRTYPRGFDFEIFSIRLLEETYRKARAQPEIEHVTPYIYQQKIKGTKLVHYTRTTDASQYRLTVDTLEDLQLIRTLIEEHQAQHLSAEEIIRIMEITPELSKVNAHVEQKKLSE